MATKTDKRGTRDRNPRDIPAYTTIEAAHYLRIPENTIRAWLFGRSYTTPDGHRRSLPAVIEPGSQSFHSISFVNLVEVHVLDSMRRKHQLQMHRIRKAVHYLREHFHSLHPLADEVMDTDGKDVFVTKYGELINASRHGQLAMKAVLEAYLSRIERDPRGLAVRLFPFTRKHPSDVAEPELLDRAPRIIAIDPAVAFGRPVILGSRIPTVEVAERFKAGDSVKELARDYERPEGEIEEAIRCELEAA